MCERITFLAASKFSKHPSNDDTYEIINGSSKTLLVRFTLTVVSLSVIVLEIAEMTELWFIVNSRCNALEMVERIGCFRGAWK